MVVLSFSAATFIFHGYLLIFRDAPVDPHFHLVFPWFSDESTRKKKNVMDNHDSKKRIVPAVNPIMNHPQNHKFYWCYKPFPNGRFGFGLPILMLLLLMMVVMVVHGSMVQMC